MVNLSKLKLVQTQPLTRRTFLKQTALAASPLLAATTAPPLSAAAEAARQTLKVVCVGAHPDDPESGCGGTLARYGELGHSVTIFYLTRGERGIRDKGLDDSAQIRSAEAETACKTLGAKPVFFGQIDGATELTRAHVDRMTKLLSDQNPDVVFTHWPIDTHMDHQVASILSIRACLALSRKTHLYFFEVDLGGQTQGFFPNTYVDITGVLEKKKSALFAHTSQDGQGIWREHHEVMAKWRGREVGLPAAEAFVHHNGGTHLSQIPGI